jgi:hypothetical protein
MLTQLCPLSDPNGWDYRKEIGKLIFLGIEDTRAGCRSTFNGGRAVWIEIKTPLVGMDR